MTPEEIAAEEEKKRAFKQWAGGMFENMQYGGAPHFNPQTGEYVRNQGGLSVTNVQRLPDRGSPDAPPMERPTFPTPPPEGPTAPPARPAAPVTPQELEPSSPASPEPAEPEDSAAPAEEGEDKEQGTQANQKANAAFRNYMKLFGSPRRR